MKKANGLWRFYCRWLWCYDEILGYRPMLGIDEMFKAMGRGMEIEAPQELKAKFIIQLWMLDKYQKIIKES